MKKLTLALVALLSLGIVACDQKTGTKTHEESTVNGTRVERNTSTETSRDGDGNTSRETKTQTTVDPEGMMNKQTETRTTTESQERN